MKSWTREPKTMLIVVALLLLLLPLLAMLQYRWLGQVSEGEREQLKWNLRTTARRFAQDFDRELTLAYAAFASAQSELDPKDYLTKYDRWQSTAQHPQLIREILLARLDDNDHLTLKRLNPELHDFVPHEWPEEMKPLEQRLEQHFENTSRLLASSSRAQSPDAEASVREILRRPMPVTAEEVPALIVPILSPPVVRENGEISLRPASGVVILRLNQNYIQQELLPALARRHFDAEKEVNYNVAIVSRQEPRRVLYQFGPHLAQSQTDQDALRADVTAGLFGLRYDELRNLMRSRATEAEANNQRARVTAQPVEMMSPASTPAQRTEQSAAPLPNEDNRPWQMLIRHRAGSLDAAVASVRRRNLIISFGIMAMLAVSVVLMSLSSRRAQRLARQQIEFVAGVSHELRTPLAVIRSAGENLADGVIRDNEQIKRYGKLIRDEGRRLTEMVEQVLEFAGTQSGRRKYDLSPTSVSDLIERALAAAQPLAAEGGFEIEKRLAPALPEVMADVPALSRALQNLLSNAMKYSGESRWIGISARSASNGRGAEVQIVIEDKGLGIPAAELPHIFEPFYRGTEVVAAQIHGNGLGLSLVKSIVEAHGGSVSVKSSPGRGSSFTVTLPASPPATELTGETKSVLSLEQ
ncbi:MAG TPA: HAMP domain-containing sensor histidine kinase [Blastocatellia bacterium]|nr:HAMP domain-containing sensor histidine kinase [Blastocatellia bacterium]